MDGINREVVRSHTRAVYNHLNQSVFDGQLPRWGSFRVTITSGVQRLGCCRFRGGQLVGMTISRKRRSMDDVDDTVRHETAHVAHRYLGNGGSSHGAEWKRYAVMCGAEPKSCSAAGTVVTQGAYPYTVSCAQCGIVGKWTRASPNWKKIRSGMYRFSCKKCGGFDLKAQRQG